MTYWPVKTLGEMCDDVQRLDPSKTNSDVFTYVDLSSIDQKSKSVSGARVVSVKEAPGRARQLVRKNDVLVSTVRPNLNAVALIGDSLDGAIASTGFCVLRPIQNIIDSRLVFAWIRSRRFIDELSSMATGTSYPAVTDNVVKSLEMPVPPLEEQKRIVALLDAATAHVTELTACYEQARTHANNLFTSASREAFESNPDWPVKTIGDVCAVLDSLRKPITKRDRISGDYPYYGATGIVDYVGDYIFDERLVLVGEDGAKWDAGDTTAFIAEGKYWVNNHAHVLRCKPGVLVDSWLTHFLTMSDLNRYVSGLTVPKLNQGSLVSIAIPVPPLEEQERIVGHLDSMKAKTSEMVAAYDAKLTAAKNLRQSFLESAFEGKL